MERMIDEATRAKSNAEEKFEKKDYVGARSCALHAQSLYPDLVGIAHLVTMLQVYASAEKKINGEEDWYSVLGVDPSAEEETIKKRYRNLALMLHPDKNSCNGAEDAFKLISEACSLLLDKKKRLEYNTRMGYYSIFQQNFWTHIASSSPSRPSQDYVPTHTGSTSAPSSSAKQNGGTSSPDTFCLFGQKIQINSSGPSASSLGCAGGPSAPYLSRAAVPSNFGSKETLSRKIRSRCAKRPREKSARGPSDKRSDTFWTMCHRCNRKYEHRKIFCNLSILCHICLKPFLASEIVPPTEFVQTANLFGQGCSDSAS